jgi:hypothetical protein
MVTYSNLGGYGRLGNQMFQIASTIGVAKDNGLDYGFDSWVCKYTFKDFNNFIESPLKKLNPDVNKTTLSRTEEEYFYKKTILDPSYNHILNGYYQSEKYFENYKDYIRNIFKLKPEYNKYIMDNYSDILENSCSIHIRRGDYLGLQDHHTLINLDYYNESLKLLYGNDLENINLLIFSDDILWCKQNLNFEKANIHYIENNIDIIDMFLMSMCENNIIANSSFSWWGAWLNKSPNKKVIAPKKWFGPKNSHLSTHTLYCKEWITI